MLKHIVNMLKQELIDTKTASADAVIDFFHFFFLSQGCFLCTEALNLHHAWPCDKSCACNVEPYRDVSLEPLELIPPFIS